MMLKHLLPSIVLATAAVSQANAQPVMKSGATLQYRGKPFVAACYGTYGMVAELKNVGTPLEQFNYHSFFQNVRNDQINCVRVWVTYHWANSLAPFDKIGSRYDLTRMNDQYFRRLKDFVAIAESFGIVVQVTLFDAVQIETSGGNRWPYSPYNQKNNVNGFVSNPGQFDDLDHPIWASSHARLINRVVAELGNFGNVIYEVANEPDISETMLSRAFCEKVVQTLRSALQSTNGSKVISVNANNNDSRSPINQDWAFAASGVDLVSMHLSPSNLGTVSSYNTRPKPVWISTDGYRGAASSTPAQNRPVHRSDDFEDLMRRSLTGAALGHKGFEVLDNGMLGTSWTYNQTSPPGYDPSANLIDRDLLSHIRKVYREFVSW